MREMIYAQWMGISMPFWQMVVRVCAATLFGVLLAGPVMLCMLVVLPAVFVPRMLCDAALSLGWEAYSLTMPAGRRNVVTSQYVLVLCCNAAAAVLCFSSMAICRLLNNTVTKIPVDGAWLPVCVAWAMAASGLMLAISHRWGLNRANYLVVGGVGILYLLIALVRRTDALYQIWRMWGGRLMVLLSDPLAAALLLAAAGCAVFLLCSLWSVHTYQRKEL